MNDDLISVYTVKWLPLESRLRALSQAHLGGTFL